MLRRFSWFTLGLNVFVVLLGAVVRATGSGAGCGASWPTCAGEVVPTNGATETLVEFSHRAASGLALLAVLVLVAWVFRTAQRGDLVRKAAAWSVFAILSEAAIGAVIVLFEWVADNASVARAVAVPLHLVNTFVLLAALTTTAWWVTDPPAMPPIIPKAMKWAGLGLLVVAATGSITALADTLHPAASLSEGLGQDFTASGTWLTQIRVLHPVIATVVGAYVAYLGFTRAGPGRQQRLGLALAVIVGTQVFAGMANVVLLAPVWLQLLHLALADGLWIVSVLFVLAGSGNRKPAVP